MSAVIITPQEPFSRGETATLPEPSQKTKSKYMLVPVKYLFFFFTSSLTIFQLKKKKKEIMLSVQAMQNLMHVFVVCHIPHLFYFCFALPILFSHFLM